MAIRGGPNGEQFSIGEYWLGREKLGGPFYRYWLDRRRRWLRRRTLKTTDWEAAKVALAKFSATETPAHVGSIVDPAQVLLTAVLRHYEAHRATKIRKGDEAKRAFAYLEEFLFQVKHLPATLKADGFGLDLQIDFARWLATFGTSASYITRLMNPIAAAMHFAAREQPIESAGGGTQIVRLMKYSPEVRFHVGWVGEVADLDEPTLREWTPSIEEMARFIDNVKNDAAFRFIIVALNTWARPETILAVDFERQIRKRDGMLDMNPLGRRQNKKRRPVIPVTDNLAAWLEEWKSGRPLSTRASVTKAIELTNARWMMREAAWNDEKMAPLFARRAEKARFAVVRELEAKRGGRFNPRTFRTFMATHVRTQEELGARDDMDYLSDLWLGHRSPRTAARHYEVVNRNYLKPLKERTDLIMKKIGALTRVRSVWPPSAQPDLPLLRLVGGIEGSGK